MARILTTASLLIAFSLFSALQTGASPIQIPDHHSKRTKAKRDEADLMKRDPLASLHESLHELVERQSGSIVPGLPVLDTGALLTGTADIISSIGALLSGLTPKQG